MTARILSSLAAFAALLSFDVQAQDGRQYPNHSAEDFVRRPPGRMVTSDTRYDVVHYRLDITVDTDSGTIRGSVRMKARCLVDQLSNVRLDLMNSLTVDSVVSGATTGVHQQTATTLTALLDRTYAQGELFDITVYYHGVPGRSGFESFVFSSHNGTPWVWSLSEPYGARDWWPCKDHPSDKADSVDVLITCDSSFKAASNGILVSITDNGDGTKTHYWRERYPIATYLVSVTITNFVEFTDWVHISSTDSMPVLNYVLPDHLDEGLAAFGRTPAMLRIFSDLFGPYPFADEKYGHAEFGWGGAMEHQTMTSITFPFRESTIAHELAHQWFGDLITMRTWPDIWLNEGFASYAEALYSEVQYGTDEYWTFVREAMNLAETAEGTLSVQDTTSVGELFDRNRSYKKGSVVLHMLRHVLGDSVFFRAIRNYVDDSSVRFATASTGDFKNICEQTSGQQLDYFFDQWVFGERFPAYTYSWISTRTDDGHVLRLQISQTTGTSNPVFFTMPIEFTCTSPGWDTTFVLFNDRADQEFVVPHLSRQPTQVLLDPGEWILKTATAVDSQGRPFNPYRFNLNANFPNPFNGSTVIEYELSDESDVVLDIYNVLGQRIRTLLTVRLWRGPHQIAWDGRDDQGRAVASGVYICRLKAGARSTSRKMMLVK